MGFQLDNPIATTLVNYLFCVYGKQSINAIVYTLIMPIIIN